MTKTLLSLFLFALSLNTQASNDKAYLIQGKVSAQSPACHSKKTNVYLSTGKELLFQSLIPTGGSFSFWVPKGNYDIVATTDSFCFSAFSIEAKKDFKSLDLKLTGNFTSYMDSFFETEKVAELKKQLDRMPASLGARGSGGYQVTPQNNMFGNVPPMQNSMPTMFPSPMTQGGNCAMCDIQAQMQALMLRQQQVLMALKMSNPSQLMYSNVSTPCAWQGNGCASQRYPSGGPMVMGKPNIYFSKIPSKGAKVQIKLPKGSRMIATAPAMEKTWNILGTKDGGLMIGDTKYGYIHYDFRNQLAGLQNTEGYCTAKENLVGSVVGILKELKFTEASRQDFTDYFTTKIPNSKEYCVYPQLEKQIATISRLNIQPKPDSFLRINFVIVPSEARELTKSKFSKKPTKEWKTPNFEKTGFSVQEWGMGFMIGQKL